MRINATKMSTPIEEKIDQKLKVYSFASRIGKARIRTVISFPISLSLSSLHSLIFLRLPLVVRRSLMINNASALVLNHLHAWDAACVHNLGWESVYGEAPFVMRRRCAPDIPGPSVYSAYRTPHVSCEMNRGCLGINLATLLPKDRVEIPRSIALISSRNRTVFAKFIFSLVIIEDGSGAEPIRSIV